MIRIVEDTTERVLTLVKKFNARKMRDIKLDPFVPVVRFFFSSLVYFDFHVFHSSKHTSIEVASRSRSIRHTRFVKKKSGINKKGFDAFDPSSNY